MASSGGGKLIYICDWLPPDFGAVGQYSLGIARDYAEREGREVVLIGLSSSAASTERLPTTSGSVLVERITAPTYNKGNLPARLWWTLRTDARLIRAARRHRAGVGEVIFTGSPPFLLHCLMFMRSFPRETLTYRIQDFHPECLIESLGRRPWYLALFYRLTVHWRRQVPRYQASGEDQILRLAEIGIPRDRIALKRDPSPIEVTGGESPLPIPESLAGHKVLLYSGNLGVAHEVDTFTRAYIRHHKEGSGRVALWLNAVGAGADHLQTALEAMEVPLHRSRPLPLDQLARLLMTPAAHLITLKPNFWGFVLPSKVYGCIDSGKPILYVGPKQSDVHLLCAAREGGAVYRQANPGDIDAVVEALEALGGVGEGA